MPFFEERETLAQLHSQLVRVLEKEAPGSWEILLVDDGSQDGSWEVASRLGRADRTGSTRAVRLRRNFGKSVALDTGFRLARGAVLITMDADLQDDPEEIPALLKRLTEGADVVSGWKKNRQDPWSKTGPSWLFNRVTAWLTGISLHDFNCGFKAYRREVVRQIHLFGELHRYIPVLAASLGFRVAEVPVRHHPRRWGRSKFGWSRFSHGLLDLVTVLATTRYLRRPGHLLGGLALVIGSVGMVSLIYLTVLWLLGHGPIGQRPLLFFGMLCVVVATQLMTMGLMAELMLRHAPPLTPDQVVVEIEQGDRQG